MKLLYDIKGYWNIILWSRLSVYVKPEHLCGTIVSTAWLVIYTSPWLVVSESAYLSSVLWFSLGAAASAPVRESIFKSKELHHTVHIQCMYRVKH